MLAACDLRFQVICADAREPAFKPLIKIRGDPLVVSTLRFASGDQVHALRYKAKPEREQPVGDRPRAAADPLWGDQLFLADDPEIFKPAKIKPQFRRNRSGFLGDLSKPAGAACDRAEDRVVTADIAQ
jgi:hypothetical protein